MVIASRTGSGDKRESIMKVAWDLFQRHGFKRVSVDDIARLSSVSKGSIYNYFASKEALFRAIVEENLREPRQQALAIADTDAALESRVMEMLHVKIGYHYFTMYTQHASTDLIDDANRIAGDIIESDYEQYRAALGRVLRAPQGAGPLQFGKFGTDADECAATLIAMAHGLARHGALIVEPTLFRRRLDAVIRMMFAGLNAAPE